MAPRDVASCLLAALATVALLAGGFLTYAGQVLSSPDAFAERAARVLAEPSVRDLVADEAAAQIVRRVPELAAARTQLVAAVRGAVESRALQAAFGAAIADAQRAVLGGGRDGHVIVLRDVRSAIVPFLGDELDRLVPDPLVVSLDVLDDRDVADVVDTAQAIERRGGQGQLLLVVGVVALALSAIAASDLGRGARRMGTAVLLAAGGLLVLLGVLGGDLRGSVDAGLSSEAAGAVWDVLVGDLRAMAYGALAFGAVAVASGFLVASTRPTI